MVIPAHVFVLFCSYAALLMTSCTGRPRPEIKGNSAGAECVVLLHGLARTCRAMEEMERALQEAGYQTVNLDYSSRKKTIEDIAAQDFVRGVELCSRSGAEKIHFVTHSLGGLIVRLGLRTKKPQQLGRVVMLAPPNKGSFVTDRMEHWWLYRWLNGPAGQELSTAPDSLPHRLGPVDYPVGIIAGNKHACFDAWFASFTPEENDGKVTVQSTKVEGMTDFLLVDETHPFIMKSDKVIKETIQFLHQGRFNHP